MNLRFFFFFEKNKNKNFCLKIIQFPLLSIRQLICFCWNVSDAIHTLFETDLTENKTISLKEKRALNYLVKYQNVEICINNTDKNLGAISADKEDIITECRRQLYDVITYNKMSWEEAKNLIDKIKSDLKNIIRKHMEKVHVNIKKQNFCYLKLTLFQFHISTLSGKF